MQNKYTKLLIIILAVAIIVPQVALAAWWNPFSWNWGWVNRVFHFQQAEQKQEQQQNQNNCKKESEQCGYSFGKKIGDCCEGFECKAEESNLPDASAKCVKKSENIVGEDWTKYSQDELMAMYNEDWKNQPMFFKDRRGNYLIIDMGTAPYPRGLLIFDLNSKKEVLNDRYSIPLDITDATVKYWMPTKEKVTAQNCPESAGWYENGLGAELETHISFDLKTLEKNDLGEQHRCRATQ